MAIPTNIMILANKVRNAIYGREVRESIAESMEITGETAEDAKQRSIDQTDRVDTLIQKNPQPSEVVDARLGHPTLRNKIQSVDSQLSNAATYDYVDMVISNIVSGAPKGTFTTLADLQNAYPKGADGVFLVLENDSTASHVYYWSGSDWADAGVYHADGLASLLTTDGAPWEVV